MTDPRAGQRAMLAQWLRIRARVRALAASLVAAERGLERDARRSDDCKIPTLTEQLTCERRAVDALGAELDVRIAGAAAQCDALEACYVETIVVEARLGLGRTTKG